MKFHFPVLAAAILVASQPSGATQVEEVRSNPNAPQLPEDLFRLPPGTWAFAKQLWKGDELCTADVCEAGYTAGDLAVSVERSKTFLRVVAGFRGCANVSWNEYEVGKKASKYDTKTIAKRIKRISIKTFMDAWTMNVERLQQCCVHVASTGEDEPVRIPFCARQAFAALRKRTSEGMVAARDLPVLRAAALGSEVKA